MIKEAPLSAFQRACENAREADRLPLWDGLPMTRGPHLSQDCCNLFCWKQANDDNVLRAPANQDPEQ